MSRLDEHEFFDLVSHPVRRQIIRLLSQGIYVTYSDLKEFLDMSPGGIYHHLEKLREQGILRQRSTKEYELTATGLKVIEYLDRIQDDEFQGIIAQSPIRKLFLFLPLAGFIQKNPIHWIVEAGLLFLVTTLIQIEFPIQIIGPFLLPSLEPFTHRFLFQLLSFLLMVILVLILAQLFSKPLYRTSNLILVSGLLVLPLLSSIASCILWLITLSDTYVPAEIYWIVTIVLLSSYAYLLIHLLIQIKKISVERAIIVTLIQGYAFLTFVFLFA
ncbi:MAG: winged helix-turn-helix domain-containing protein [Candidatus Hodarchaeota archaeon]